VTAVTDGPNGTCSNSMTIHLTTRHSTLYSRYWCCCCCCCCRLTLVSSSTTLDGLMHRAVVNVSFAIQQSCFTLS